MQKPEELLRQMAGEDTASEVVEDIPAITKLNIDVQGTRGKRYQGEFIFKVPTLADQITIGRLKNTYLPTGGAADANAAILVEQISYLAVTIQEPKPEWWQPFDMYDAAPIGALYGEALTYERKFHGADEVEQGAERRAGQPPTDEAPGHDEVREAHVGRKVRPSAQRRETIVAHSERSG